MDERILTIQGWMLERELNWLHETADNLLVNSLVVEIGSWKGRSTAGIWDGMKLNGKLVTIDNWLGQPSFRFTDHREATESDLFLIFMDNMRNLGFNPQWYKKGCANGFYYLRMNSVDAAKLFDDKSIDWLFIDGDHDTIDSDLTAWLPKIKKGGLISGHDFSTGFAKLRADVDLIFSELNCIDAGSIWFKRL